MTLLINLFCSFWLVFNVVNVQSVVQRGIYDLISSESSLSKVPAIRLSPPSRDTLLTKISQNDENVVHTLNKAWSEWTDWSFCSKPCGRGVSMRTRRCVIVADDGISRDCDGSNVQHKVCNIEPCLDAGVDSRTLQCAFYNNQPVFSSAAFQWVPYRDENIDPCILMCMAANQNFYRNFGTVQDGTPCWNDRFDVCVDGKCLKAGCDQILGSNATKDACGVCGGSNSTCFHYADSYQQMTTNLVEYDYNEIATIPSGATHIRITEKSSNYIALMVINGLSAKYILNGKWVIGSSSHFSAAGTLFKYERTANVESLTATGPILEDIIVMMLYLGEKPELEYDYWKPHGVLAKHSYRYSELSLGEVFSERSGPDIDYYVNLYDEMVALEPTTKTTTTTSTASTASSTTTSTTTATISLATLPRSTGRPRRPRPKNRESSVFCKQCRKLRDRKGHFCGSDFVIRARILSRRKMKSEEYRYDIRIIKIYKSTFTLMKREYLWVYSSCCPKFRPQREYLIMGKKKKMASSQILPKIWEMSLSRSNSFDPTSKKFARQETRLVADSQDYWRTWKKTYEEPMKNMASKLKCANNENCPSCG